VGRPGVTVVEPVATVPDTPGTIIGSQPQW